MVLRRRFRLQKQELHENALDGGWTDLQLPSCLCHYREGRVGCAMLDAADWGISSLIPTAISADGSTVIGGGFNREALVHQGYVWPLEGELRFVGGLTG